VLKLELALDLKAEGLLWTPEVGDCFATRLKPTWWLNGKKGGGDEILLLTGQPTENGYYGWSMVDTEPFCELYTHDGLRQEENWQYLEQNFVWLPRVDQLVRELGLRTRSFHILGKSPCAGPEEKTGFWVAWAAGEDQEGEAPPDGDYYAQTLEEALALALLSLLKGRTEAQ